MSNVLTRRGEATSRSSNIIALAVWRVAKGLKISHISQAFTPSRRPKRSNPDGNHKQALTQHQMRNRYM